MPPRLISITTVKNEADIVEAFIRHTATFVDDLVIVDNASCDGTSSILSNLLPEFPNLTVRHDSTIGYYQWTRMTALMRSIALERQPAFILPLDADEFLDGANVNASLKTLAPDAPTAVHWRTYVPSQSDDPTNVNPVLRIQKRLASEPRPQVKIIIPGHLALSPEHSLSQGNHELLLNHEPLPNVERRDLSLAHFPIRTVSQSISKVAIGALQFLAAPELIANQHFHLFSAFRALSKNCETFCNSLTEIALSYQFRPGDRISPSFVHDPVGYRGAPLKWPVRAGNEVANAFSIVLRYGQELALNFSVLSAFLLDQQQGGSEHVVAMTNRLVGRLQEQEELIAELHRSNRALDIGASPDCDGR